MKIIVLRQDNQYELLDIPSGAQFEVFESANRCAIVLRNGFNHIFTVQGKYLGAGFRKANPVELMGDSLAAFEAQRIVQTGG